MRKYFTNYTFEELQAMIDNFCKPDIKVISISHAFETSSVPEKAAFYSCIIVYRKKWLGLF